MRSILKHKLLLIPFLLLVLSLPVLAPAIAFAAPQQCGGGDPKAEPAGAYVPIIDIGCKGQGNQITDASFAIIRFLSNGVGLIIIGSIIVGGIQYTASRGDPQATANAIKRIQSTMIALVIFIFGYAILNYILPAGFFK